ncbi:hypothetical protein Aperf_G00000058482 [Anoplocephala perfoliata]
MASCTKSSSLSTQNFRSSHHYHRGQHYRGGHSRVEILRRRRHGASSIGSMTPFAVTVENALTCCDIESPGSRTAPPPHPFLSSIRQSPEVCRTVWNEFYQLKQTLLPKDLQHQLRQPTFNNWSYSDAQLLRFVRFFFTADDGLTPCPSPSSRQDGPAASSPMVDDRLCLARRCCVPEENLDAWLCAVYAKYNCVPFHNFKHAFMVAQMMYASICSADLASLFGHLDLLTLLFAAVCHDLDHPGLNNLYQNNSQSRLSICYNTLSPLENHHCAVAFELVRTPATNIFVNFTTKEFETVRQNTVRCILGTDMAKHTDILEAFTAKMVEHSIEGAAVAIRGGLSASESADTMLNGTAPTISHLTEIFDEDDESHALTMVVLLKMCDISTEIRPDIVARPWLEGLIDELSNQRELERRNNLPLSPVMDESNLVQCQINFLSFAMLPLAKSLISIIPALETCFLKPTQEQLIHYRQLAAEKAANTQQSQQQSQSVSSLSDTSLLINDEPADEHNANIKSGSEVDESNRFSLASIPLPIPPRDEGQQRKQSASSSLQPCFSSSNPDRDSSGRSSLHHDLAAPMYSSGGLAVSSGGSALTIHKRTSIVSSAGLIDAELASPHRPLRRSLGELPWSAHALLLTHFEDTIPHPPPPPPPPRSNRPIVMTTPEEISESRKSCSTAGHKASSS